jgi:DNA-binding MarR family transcriptional regulator
MPNTAALKRAKVQKLKGKAALDLRNYVPYQVTFLAGSVSRVLGAVMESKFGLNSAQWRIMAILGTFAPLSTFEISSRTSLEKSAVSRTISELIARGLVVRSVNPTDRRLLMLRFSPKGRQLFERMAAAGLEYEAFVLGHIPREHASVLAGLLSTIHEASLEYESANAAGNGSRQDMARAPARRRNR